MRFTLDFARGPSPFSGEKNVRKRDANRAKNETLDLLEVYRIASRQRSVRSSRQVSN